jgi:outer membrane protein
MRTKNLLVVLGGIVLGLAMCATSYAAADKVGYINLQRLVNESKMGKDAKADLQKMREEKQAVLNNKLTDINKLRKFINDQGDKLPARERREKVELYQKMYKDFQRLVADAKEDITREDRQLVAIILEKANDILKKVAKKKKFGIILKDPNAIGYLDPGVDITDMVLQELNKKK